MIKLWIKYISQICFYDRCGHNKNYVKETIEKNKKIKKTTLEKIKSLLSFK